MSDHDILSCETLTEQQRGELLKRIYKALAGDPLNPDKPGLVRRVDALDVEVNGCVETKTIGLKEKVETMWEGRIKFLAICAAIVFLVGLLSWLLPFLFSVRQAGSSSSQSQPKHSQSLNPQFSDTPSAQP